MSIKYKKKLFNIPIEDANLPQQIILQILSILNQINTKFCENAHKNIFYYNDYI